jgi:two-component system, OmpR family, response regulator
MYQDLCSVLYVDDDPDICTVVEATLCTIGDLRVRTANSGEVAIDLACEQRPDLILMDVMMPGLDGPSTLNLMRCCAAIADVPVIFLTAKVMPTEISQLLTLGAIGVLGKPFDPTRLCGDMLALWERAGRGGAVRRARISQDAAVEVNSLTGGFLERAQRDVGRLRQLLERLWEGEKSALRELERLAHSIHGSAAMFGFPAMSETGGAIEDMARALVKSMDDGAVFDADALKRMSDCTRRLADEVEAAGIVVSSRGSAASAGHPSALC